MSDRIFPLLTFCGSFCLFIRLKKAKTACGIVLTDGHLLIVSKPKNTVLYLFELLLAKFVLSFLGLEEAVELFLLLTLNMLLELLFIIGKRFCLTERNAPSYSVSFR